MFNSKPSSQCLPGTPEPVHHAHDMPLVSGTLSCALWAAEWCRTLSLVGEVKAGRDSCLSAAQMETVELVKEHPSHTPV